NNASYKVRVSRLEALQLQIENELQVLGMKQNNQFTDLLSDVYNDSYYRSLYELQKGIGIGTTFSKLDKKTNEKAIKTPWLGENYSQRIWRDTDRLARTLETKITQSIIGAKSNHEIIEEIADRMDVGYRNAQRLVRTELAHIQSESTFDSYRKSRVVQKYEFLATLDEKTCPVCGPLDGKVFTMAEKLTGVNFAPLHPNCRCDTVPYFDDELDVGKRAARNSDGEVYYVPGNITYEKWQKDYVESTNVPEVAVIKPKEYRNFSSVKDVKEWEEVVTPTWLASLTETEKQAINRYSGSAYRYINGNLRRGENDVEWNKVANDISSAIRKFDLMENLVLYRGMDNLFEGIPIEQLIGFEYTDKAFQSTSLLEKSSFDGAMKMVIRIPAGSRAALINPISEFKDLEYEMLLDKDTRLRILEAEQKEGILYLVTEVIDND